MGKDDINPEIFSTLSPVEKDLASKYDRIETRGKLGTPVPVLLTPSQVKAIELLLSCRSRIYSCIRLHQEIYLL